MIIQHSGRQLLRLSCPTACSIHRRYITATTTTAATTTTTTTTTINNNNNNHSNNHNTNNSTSTNTKNPTNHVKNDNTCPPSPPPPSSSSSSSTNNTNNTNPTFAAGGIPTIDISRLPNTIPGVSREELAARLAAYQQTLQQKTAAAAERELAREMDVMRRAMPPEEFRRFVASIDAMTAEEARLSAMSPAELYRYQRREWRRRQLRQMGKTVMFLVAFFGSIFFMFFLFFFFH